MNRFAKSKYILFCILILAAALRLWKLSTIPPGLTPDEAALGYNAYSILKTGRDEYGKFLPVIFKSFGDYKPGFYVYLTVPSIAVFGLSEFAVRFPSAIAGITAILLIYLIVEEFQHSKKMSTKGRLSFVQKSGSRLGIAASFMLAISPWHILFSRGAWEINVSLTLTLLGIYFFLKSLGKAKFLIPSLLSFALTLVTYQGAKLSTVLVIVIIFVTFGKEIFKMFKNHLGTVGISFLLGLLISLPIIFSFLQGKTGRLEVFSIFSYPRSQENLVRFLKEGNENVGSLSYYLFHSESLNFVRAVSGRYFNHFSGRFLFFEGDYQNPRHSAPNHGMLLLSDLIFLILGMVYLVRKNDNLSKFVFLWLIVSPLPAVLTRDQVQAVRAYNMVVPLVLISASGVYFTVALLNRIKNSKIRNSSYIILIFVFLASLIYFLDSYFTHLPIHNAKYWSYGYREVVNIVTPIQKNYNKIIFQQSYDQPYIYFLFYQKYDPKKYQEQAKLTESKYGDVGLVEDLDNIRFQGYSWPYATGEKGILLIGNDVAIPPDYSKKDYNLISEIKYPDSLRTAFRIIEPK